MSLTPEGTAWGSVSYSLPPGDGLLRAMIDVAPISLAASIATACAVLCFTTPMPLPSRKFLFVGVYSPAVGEFLFNARGILGGIPGHDLTSLSHGPSPAPAILFLSAGLLAVGLGFFMQRHMFGTAALSPKAYATASIALLLLVSVI